MNTTSSNSTLGPGGPLARTTIAYACDHGELSWSPSDDPESDNLGEQMFDGYLFGSDSAVRRLFTSLHSAPDTVDLVPGVAQYAFTDGRDTLNDLVAAMVLVGQGRGRLNEAGWARLFASDGLRAAELPEGALP